MAIATVLVLFVLTVWFDSMLGGTIHFAATDNFLPGVNTGMAPLNR
jgi:hypothetical protein